jgi:hypothetical protein
MPNAGANAVWYLVTEILKYVKCRYMVLTSAIESFAARCGHLWILNAY